MFAKRKACFIAKLYKTDLHTCRNSGWINFLSDNQIKTVKKIKYREGGGEFGVGLCLEIHDDDDDWMVWVGWEWRALADA